jgi:NitT/TauT family transport system ATP-binding protein
VTVLMVTHNIREALRLADRLIVLSPRPAHVVGAMEVPLPREERRGPALEALLRDLVGQFPDLAAG